MASKNGIISTSVGNGKLSDPNDVLTIRNILNDLGYEDNNLDFSYIDQQLNKNIRAFQKDNDLKEDGIINPGGETEAAMMSAMDDSDGSYEEAARSPRFRCPECTGFHGGVSDDNLCPDCHGHAIRNQDDDDTNSEEDPELDIDPLDTDIIIG